MRKHFPAFRRMAKPRGEVVVDVATDLKMRHKLLLFPDMFGQLPFKISERLAGFIHILMALTRIEKHARYTSRCEGLPRTLQ